VFCVSFAHLSLSTAVSHNMCSVVPLVLSAFQCHQRKCELWLWGSYIGVAEECSVLGC